MSIRSRPTSLGWGALGLAALTLLAAVSTTNNLLYLLFSGVVSALLVSWLAGRGNLRRLSAQARFPDQVFRGDTFRLDLALRNEGLLPVLGVWVREAWVERLDPGAPAAVAVPFRFAHRGRNAAAGLAAESLFPLGLFLHRRSWPEAVGIAFPKPREIHCAAEISAEASFTGRPLPKKGRGDELYGIRDYSEADDSRLINWKLSAKAGKPLVNEYCLPGESRVTIRVEGAGAGDEADRAIAEAASAFRYYIDTGAEVRLLTPEGGLDYGKGLLHLDQALRLLAELGEGKLPRPSRVPFAASRGVADSAALRRLGFLGAGLVYAGLFLIDEIGAGLLAALSPLVPLGWVLYELKVRRLPKPVWDGLSLAVLVYVAVFDWRLAGVVMASVHLVLYLLANRALNELAAAEQAQFLLILLLGAFFVSGLAISPWYFLFFILFAAFCGTWLSLACGLSFAARRRWLPALAGLAAPWAAATALLFVLSPRTEGLRRLNPFVAMGIDKLQVRGSSVAGFTERISLGWYGEIRKSTARVMRIRPLAAPAVSGIPPVPAGRTSIRPAPGGEKTSGAPPLLVRGAALDTFDGRAWTKDKVDFQFRMDGRTMASAAGRGWAVRSGERLVFPAEDGPPLPELEFHCYPMNLSVVFTVGSLSAVRLPGGSASFDHTDTAYFSSPYTGGVRFVSSRRQASLGFSRSFRGYDRLLRQRFLQLPPGEDPRIADLARRWTTG
ncbi:MAG: transglutaminaseTgpA domain-containing protein, partial [Elusimicrobia bacterium]|nr:transglutaminaseTgpA domain-containing protein [Elusimicrobiota bacterium]